MAKPSTVVDWDATGNIVEPSPGKKTAGWLPGEQPPAQYMNWLFSFLGQWSQYLNGLESTEALTWALAQIFNRGITVGASFAANETEAISPRVTAEPVSSAVADYTNLLKAKDARVWSEGVGSNSALVFTVNATRTTAGADTWVKITNSQPALALFVSRAGLSICHMPAAQNTAWPGAFVEGEGTASGWGRLFFLNTAQTTQTDTEQDAGVINTPVNGTAERKLLWTIKDGTRGVRLYYIRNGGPTGGDGLEIAVNCTYGNVANLWTHDTTNSCMKLSFSRNEFVIQWKVSAASGTTFSDSAWTLTPLDLLLPQGATGVQDHTQGVLSNGHLKVVNTQSADLDDANPPAQTNQANKVGVRNINKVTASLLTGASAAVLSGYNIAASTPISIGGDVLTLNFNAALDQAAYECTVTCEDSSIVDFYVAQVNTKNVGSVVISVAKLTVGGAISLVNLAVTVLRLNIHITGKQTT